MILLVAFSGLLFPPMSFAQSTHNCPSTIQIDSDTYTLTFSDSGERHGVYVSTICRYADLDGPVNELSGNPQNRLQVSVWDHTTSDPKLLTKDVPLCTDYEEDRLFTTSETYSYLTVAGTGIPKSIDFSTVKPFFNISNNAVPCSGSPQSDVSDSVSDDSTPLECMGFVEYDGDIYTLYDDEHSTSDDTRGDRKNTICRYSSEFSQNKIEFHAYWFTDTYADLKYFNGICSEGDISFAFSDKVEYESKVVFAGIDVYFPEHFKRTSSIDDGATYLLNQVYDKAQSCPYPAGDKDNIVLKDPVPYTYDFKCPAEIEQVVGKIVGIFGNVEVLRDGKWLKVSRGMEINRCDVVKTDDRGRTRIEFNDRDPTQNAGPTVVNLGPNTEVSIEGMVVVGKEEGKSREGFLELLHGTIRAFAEGWGRQSIFSVKAGVALCGIRGSDMVFSYDPQQERLSVLANEGVVSVQNTVTGNTETIVAGQTTVVDNGNIRPTVPLSSDTWQNAVDSVVISETESSTQQNQQSQSTANTSSFMDMPDMPLTKQGTINLSKDAITVIDNPVPIQIHGKSAGYLPGDSIEILIETPTGTIHKITSSVASAATYVATINIEPSDPKGVYAIIATKNGEIIAKDSLTVKQNQPDQKAKGVPDWVRNNAKWWAEGQIDDDSFIQGLQFLIKEGIMTIPPTSQGEGTGTGEIPEWIKNNAKWWAEGQIDDDSFIQGVQFLVKEGIMSVK